MEYSWRYTNILNNVFVINSTYGGLTDIVCTLETTLDKHNVFNNQFIIDISSDEIEIPVFARSAIEHTIRSKVEKAVIPMYINTYEESRKTADSIIAEFFSKVSFSQRLLKITTSKGDRYYGGKGVILDKDFNILLLCTIAGRRVKSEEKLLSYYRPIVHVNPKVFLNKECLISKSIIKKVIPFYLSHTIDSVEVPRIAESGIPRGTKPQILIDDVNRFIEKPTKPIPQDCLNSVLNQVLIDNIDDILDPF